MMDSVGDACGSCLQDYKMTACAMEDTILQLAASQGKDLPTHTCSRKAKRNHRSHPGQFLPVQAAL